MELATSESGQVNYQSIAPEIVTVVGLLMVAAIKLTCLLIGYKTIRLGYQLLVDGVIGKFVFKAELKGLKADLRSVSPGLLFVLLGCMLVAYGLFVDKPISLDKKADKENPIPEFEIPGGQPDTQQEDGKRSEIK